jgi:hypothetical protein
MSSTDILAATADIGKAAGLEAAAKVILAIADHKRRVVGTAELKAAALSLQESAAEIRAKAKETLSLQAGGKK